jgi:hypothetical protein
MFELPRSRCQRDHGSKIDRTHLTWLNDRCHGKRQYLLRENQRTGLVASRAQKTVSSRFHRFHVKRAPTGPSIMRRFGRPRTTNSGGVVAASRKPRSTSSGIAGDERTSKLLCGGTFVRQWMESGRRGTPVLSCRPACSSDHQAGRPTK